MKQSRLSLFSPIKSAGFTLLELVLVLFLIGLLASAGLLFTDNIENQAQFDETQRRLEVIRKAIIQAGDRTVNGQPELSGFVVDNGRLPYCLEELIYVDTSAVSGINYLSPCNADLTVPRPGVTDEGIRYGWWGPYIQVQPDSDGFRRFRDGYENQVDASDPNFSWKWTLQASGLTSIANPPVPTDPIAYQLAISSIGFDINDSADDYPLGGSDVLVEANDWLSAEPLIVSINFVNTSSVSAIQVNEEQDWEFTFASSAMPGEGKMDADDFELTTAVSSVDLTPGESTVISATFNTRIPAGYYRFNALCNPSCDVTSAASGIEKPKSKSGPTVLQILPNHQIAPIRWNLEPE